EVVTHMGGGNGAHASAASATAPAPAAAPAPAGASAPGAGGPDLTAVMMAVVADKTGYPAEMLSLSMDMEGDLGIDSIKRVEILSAMKERVPGLPEVDPGELAKLRTLGEVVTHMGGGATPKASTASATSTASTASTAGTGSAATAAPAPAPWRGPQPGRYLTEVVPAPAMGMVRAGLPTGAEVLVTGAPEALARALARALTDRGVPARAVAEVPVGAEPGGLVILGGLDDQDSPAQAHADAFSAAHAVAAGLAKAGGLLVTVQDTGGRFGLGGLAPARAWRGGLAGLARTAAQEWPKAAVKAVDLERGARADQELAQALADEIVAGGPELEVGLCADGQRVTLVDRAVPAAPGAQPLGPQDVILVSGGARGVTAATVVALARDSRARFVLLGRSRLQEEPSCCAGLSTDAELKRALLADAKARGEALAPAALGRQVAAVLAGREIRQTVAAIQAAGGQARYDAVDVTDAASLRSLLDQVRGSFGPITGVIHGAGVLADKLIADKSAEQFRQVFQTKVEGLAALLEATAADPLSVILLFSSVAARCGNQGQVDYAMANEVLNQVARAEAARRPGCVVKALGWGPWEGGMVTPALKARFEKLGVPVIPLDDGARMLVEEVRSPQRDQVALVLGGAPRVGQPLAAEGRQDLVLDLVVNRARQPYLADHSIHGTPVVPVVLVVEWFARAAHAFRPDLKLNGIEDIKVLSGIKLAHFDNGGDHLRVVVRQAGDGPGVSLALELLGPAGRRHYTAVARMGTSLSAGAAAPTLALPDWGGRPVYGDVLFHGEQFQVIADMQGLSREGGAATLRGVRQAGWQDEPWLTDVAAMDGGLQLALLWTREVLGGHSLPTGVGAVKLASDGPSDGPLRCVLTGRGTSGGRTLSDVVLVDQAGRTVAELQAVETHLLPSAPATAPTPQA
ncbi:SDR family oxidoreductase, partial [Myxococcota bacterium]|nr:SDR family oxidoreductase [Myxococcota bacterium]